MNLRSYLEIIEPPSLVDIVKEVSNGGIKCSDGWWLSLRDYRPIEVKPGMTVKLYGKGWGSVVRGCVIVDEEGEHHIFWYLTEEEQEEADAQMFENIRATEKKTFEKEKASLDAKYDALPDTFKRRIDKFRNANPSFRQEYEGYEIFCCEQAVIIAETLRDSNKIKELHDASWEEQLKMVPSLSYEHSGNTFGVACTLAKAYLVSPEYVGLIHGALAPLVGCKAYGCEHDNEQDSDVYD